MIKVLVVDDSALMRKIFSDILNSDPEIEVIATAIDGEAALEKTKRLQPDVVTMDIEMPEMDGITALKKIMMEHPVPVLMISAFTEKGSQQTLDAMEAGAVDFILKPSGDMDKIKDEIIAKIKIAAMAHVHKFKKIKTKKQSFLSTRKKIIVIGSSTGGPQTLEALLTQLPGNIPAPILIVQHMPPVFTKSLADRLDNLCEIEVREAKQGDELQDGVALLAPGGYHMVLTSDTKGFEGTITLNQEPAELGVRPNIDRLFKSVAKIFRENVVGVILTGMGSDGTEGAKAIKKENGTIVAEAEESCIIFGMPKSVINADLADEVVTIGRMPVALLQLLDI